MKPYKAESGLWAVDLEDAAGKTRVFEFEKMSASDQTETLLDIMSLVGEALGGLGDIYRRAGGDLDTEVSDATFQGLMRALTSNLSRDKTLTKRLIRKLSSEKVLCDGATIQYDTFYQDDLALSFAAVRANIEVQYGNFFGAAGKLLGLRRAAKPLSQPTA